MRLLVYTCVVAAYDRVFPPVRIEDGIDYVVITEDASLQVPGWRTQVVDAARFHSTRAANRHYKMLAHQLLPGYDASVYVDGNVRVLGPLSVLVEEFLATGAALGIYRHPLRQTIAEEIAACEHADKLVGSELAREEFASYRADGFPDDVGLVEAGVLLKNHSHPQLTPAMTLWWSLFERYETRDQFSLPYVLWKTKISCKWHPTSFRDPNPYFGIYPHLGSKHVSARYAYAAARAYDSPFYRALLGIWHAKWRLQRWLRRTRGSAQ